MAIDTELTKLNDFILEAYQVIEAKGGTIPTNKNMENLPAAIATLEDTHWWNDVSSLTTADIGTTREVEVNGVTHTVRLIGVDHDNLADGSGKAHTTWQFTNILSDSNGYSLATFWKDTNSTSTANYDFTNSDIRKALDGEGTGTAKWFVKSETTWSSTYSGKSVLDMLPTSLVSKLKSVSKQIATTSSYTVGTYDTKLFIPSYREMTATGSSQYVKEEGTTYSYWASHDTDNDRIIKQIKGTDGALTSYTTVTSGSYSESKYSYAGYNNSTSGYGGYIWLRSPYTDGTSGAWSVGGGGSLYSSGVFGGARGVAPCFCL